MSKPSPRPATPISRSDRQHGYRIGCEGWATKKEAAELLGRSERTVERLTDRGKLRAYKLDGDSDQSRVSICRRSLAVLVGRCEVLPGDD